MRFAVPADDARYAALCLALDDPCEPMAETWRQVSRAAERLGLPRPGYHLVRLIVRAHRARGAAGDRVRQAAVRFLGSLFSSYVVDQRRALAELHDAIAARGLVLNQHKPP